MQNMRLQITILLGFHKLLFVVSAGDFIFIQMSHVTKVSVCNMTVVLDPMFMVQCPCEFLTFNEK